jgi:hypothetical protein
MADWELCEIDCWQGYLKSDFYAHRLGHESGPEIGRSPMFRWRGGAPPPREEKILAVHGTLVRRLLDAGWEPVGEPKPWYAQRFRRMTRDDVRTANLAADERPAERGAAESTEELAP